MLSRIYRKAVLCGINEERVAARIVLTYDSPIRPARGRGDPLALESNPLTNGERMAVLAQIRQYNPGVDLESWSALLEAS